MFGEGCQLIAKAAQSLLTGEPRTDTWNCAFARLGTSHSDLSVAPRKSISISSEIVAYVPSTFAGKDTVDELHIDPIVQLRQTLADLAPCKGSVASQELETAAKHCLTN